MKRILIAIAISLALAASARAQDSGWSLIAGLNSGFPKPYNVSLSADYTKDCRLYAGAGVEVVWFLNVLVRPYADVRYAFKPAGASPFLEATAGYVFTSGADANATVGYRLPTEKSDNRHAWWVGAGVGYWSGCDGVYFPVKIEFSF